MRILTGVLVLLGVVAELWVVIGLWSDLVIDGTTPEFAVLLSPLPVAAGAAWLATWLHRRGSGWGWVVAVLPVALLVLGLGLAVLLTFHPIVLHQR